MFLQKQLTVLGRLENRVQLLEVFEVDLVKCRTALILEATERGIEPLLGVLEVIDNLIFLLHLEAVILGRFLHYVSQIEHLLFVE